MKPRVVVVALVNEPLVAKRYVEVAADEVELTAVKFWNVEEPVARRLPAVKSEFTKALVKVPLVEKRAVEVASEEVELTAVKFCNVEEAVATMLAR